ncbi:MAG: leucyl/phenylalanyl-tRNA--protein transferase, partial [Bacteroidota bacterium]|nr:leucyl/phenylalanyl-tRNA--protein transferase [Bacteroidota bacterium]
MAVILTKEQIHFPDPEHADKDGLVAIGGNLSTGSLLNAYRKGIFPWYAAPDPICWYSPDPRMVLYPQNLVVSHSMRKVLRSGP